MANEQQTPTKQLLLQKIYVKDLSFESPKSPEIFKSNATAQTQLNIRTGNRDVGDDNVEVTLTLTVESKDNDQTLFLIEIVQAGVFFLKGYTADERSVLLGSFCPSTLYPYAREAISDVATRGGFPQLLLQPINFDAIYAQARQERAAATAGAAAGGAGAVPGAGTAAGAGVVPAGGMDGSTGGDESTGGPH
jgi:preprotein translocase subunit SecB